MVDIIKIHVYYRDLNDNPHVKIIDNSGSTDILHIKQQVGKVLSKIKHRAKYYYVVIEIDKDGKSAYRTIVPKTFLSA